MAVLAGCDRHETPGLRGLVMKLAQGFYVAGRDDTES
jgi:hypothetical protein